MSHPKYKHYGSVETKLIEECSELIHALAKCQRFGLQSVNPEIPLEQRITNAEYVKREISDVKQAIHNLLVAWSETAKPLTGSRAPVIVLDDIQEGTKE